MWQCCRERALTDSAGVFDFGCYFLCQHKVLHDIKKSIYELWRTRKTWQTIWMLRKTVKRQEIHRGNFRKASAKFTSPKIRWFLLLNSAQYGVYWFFSLVLQVLDHKHFPSCGENVWVKRELSMDVKSEGKSKKLLFTICLLSFKSSFFSTTPKKTTADTNIFPISYL